MNKQYLGLIIAFSLCTAAFTSKTTAQNAFQKGNKVINVGFGLGSTLGGDNYTSTIIPLSASFDWGIVDNLFNVDKLSLGVGGYIGFAANKSEWKLGNVTYGRKYTYIIPGVRGTIHYSVNDKFDCYGGLMLGYEIVTHSEYGNWGSYSNDATGSQLYFSAFVGARYYFTNAIGAYAELGYGIAYFNLGVSFKF